MMEKKLPLEGLKVLDFTIALAGPFTAWQLADMGAEVWKIERRRPVPGVGPLPQRSGHHVRILQ